MTSPQLDPKRVLVTAIGAPGAVGIVSALKVSSERSVEVYGVDIQSYPSGKPFVKGFQTVPRGSHKDFADEIIKYCRQNEVDVVLPLATEELLTFAENKERIKQTCGTRVCISETESIRISNEKAKLFETLSDAGIPVPAYRIVNSAQEFLEACRELGYPEITVCMKPSFAHGGRGFRTIEHTHYTDHMLLESKPEKSSISIEEARRLLENLQTFPEMLVMEYLPGREYSVDLLCSAGVPIVIVPRSRDEIRSGISFVGTVEYNKEAIDICQRLCKEIRFEGPIGVQLKQAKDGTLRVLEVNPRLHGSVVLSVAAGANLPYLALKNCLGERTTVPSPKYGTKMTRFWGATFHDPDGFSYSL